MNCNEVEPLLDILLDEEMPADKAALVLAHVETCQACAEQWHALTTVRHTFKSFGEEIAMPPQMESRIWARVDAEQKPGSLYAWSNRYAWLALAACATLMFICFYITSHQSQPGYAVAISDLINNDYIGSSAGNPGINFSQVAAQTGFEIKRIQLPGWSLSVAKSCTLGNRIRPIARFTFTRKVGSQTQQLCCYQALAGQINSDQLTKVEIDHKMIALGQLKNLSLARFSQNNRDYLLVSSLPKQDLLEIAKIATGS